MFATVHLCGKNPTCIWRDVDYSKNHMVCMELIERKTMVVKIELPLASALPF